MRRKTVLVFLGLLLTMFYSVAQRQKLLTEVKDDPLDTASLISAFKRAQVHGHFRNFAAFTNNASPFLDFYANAVGGKIEIRTSPFKNFQLGVSGSFVFNVISSELSKPDKTTKQLSRYELSLFDVDDVSNKNNINRLDELYLKYNVGLSNITVGKQNINTPFINSQDSRMLATEVQGIWAELNGVKNVKINAGFFNGLSPRSTTRWYSISRSIGVYPSGVNTQGQKAQYAGNLQSAGIALAGISYNPNQAIKLQVWDQYVENIFNTALVQLDYVHLGDPRLKIFSAVQVIKQTALKDGGNEDAAKTYFDKGSKSLSFGARIGIRNTRFASTINYNRITKDGRFQMPREWGIEPLFTQLPRERNEGLGDVHAVVAKGSYNFLSNRLITTLGLGHYILPDANNYALNKYGMPSYHQEYADVRYKPQGMLKGLDLQLLYVYKGSKGAALNKSIIINKVYMSSFCLILNYWF
jgi:hypothetical protein